MALIEWRPEYATGIAGVDHEHQELIGLLNQVDVELAAAGGWVADLLGEVHARISAHFALEEHEMRDRRYDGYAAHKAEHDRLLDDLRELMDNHAAGAYREAAAALSRHLGDWFVIHFRTMDARLHRALGG